MYQASCREEHPPDRRDRVLHCQCECHRAAEAREPHHVQVLLKGGFEFLMNLLFNYLFGKLTFIGSFCPCLRPRLASWPRGKTKAALHNKFMVFLKKTPSCGN